MAEALFLLLLAVVVIAMFVFSKWLRKRRAGESQRAAMQVGFACLFQLPEEIRIDLENLSLFKTDRRGKDWGHNITDILQGTWNGIQWTVFRFEFSELEADHSSPSQTVAFAKLDSIDLPRFTLGVKNISHFHADASDRTINFTTDRKLSRLFGVRGQDDEAIRALFTPRVIEFLRKKSKLVRTSFSARPMTIIAGGDKFIFYYWCREMKPQDLTGFLEEAGEALKVFTEK